MSGQERRITVDDVKAKARRIEDMARAEARRVAQQDAAKIAVVAALAIVVAIGAAYYAGTRACRR